MSNKNKKEKTYEELKDIMNSSIGTSRYYRVNPFIRNFLITDGVKYFAEKVEAYWLCDVAASYIPRLMKIDDYFFIVSLSVEKNKDIEGIFKIFHEIDYELRVLVDQKIPYVDLPTGKYEFYFIREEENFILLCKSEY